MKSCGRFKEGNVLFNNILNTFYLWLYGVRHMVKNHSDSERGNLLPPHGLLFPISSKGYFTRTILDRIAHTTAFVTPVVEHWLEREIAQWVHPMKDRSDDPSHDERTLLPRSYISLLRGRFNYLSKVLSVNRCLRFSSSVNVYRQFLRSVQVLIFLPVLSSLRTLSVYPFRPPLWLKPSACPG